MKIIRDFEELKKFKNIPCAVALGTFDGLHLGHQDVIKTAVAAARKRGIKAMVFTFSNHPMESIMPELVPPRISDNETKETFLAEMGVDILINIPFTHQVADMSTAKFLELLQDMGVRVAVVGENYSFGAKGTGNAQTLRLGGVAFDLLVIIRKLLRLHGNVVSSTQIRNAIAQGNIKYAAEMLGRPFSLTGVVVHGDARGRTIGFPTVNLELTNIKFAIPKKGVYGGVVWANGKCYKAAINVGINPTFGKNSLHLEAHLMNFSGDLYGQTIKIELHYFLREEQKFASVDNLRMQIARDEEAVRNRG